MSKEMLFDKKQIIELMQGAFARLRKREVYVMDVVDVLRKQHPTMTRARFDDLFMIRPERDCAASVTLVADVVQVMYGFDAQIWNADELVRLLIALRVPINQISQYAAYFWGNEWGDALQKHASGLAVTTAASTLVGREELLYSLRQEVWQQRHIVLHGEAGIGKTSLALELARLYELHHAQRVYYVDAQQITSLSGLNQLIANVFQIKQMGNEPLLLRLKMVLNQRPWYVVLDGMDATADVSPAVWLQHLVHNFPTMRFIITTRVVDLGQTLPNAIQVAVPPLAYDDMQDAAARLFLRVLRQAGGRVSVDVPVLDMCRSVQGNPLMISMLANAVVGARAPESLLDPVEQMLTGLTPAKLRLVTLLVLMQRPLTGNFLQMVMPALGEYPPTWLSTALLELTRRGVVIALESSEQYAVHAVIRQVWRQRIGMSEAQHLLQTMARRLLHVDHGWEDDVSRMKRQMTPDIVAVMVHVVEVLWEFALHDMAITLLVQWHTLWIRHGLSLEAVEWCERCIVHYPENHPITMELNYVLGSLYAIRGSVNLALVYLDKALQFAHEHADRYLWARIAVERGMVGLYTVQQASDDLFVELCADMNTAITYFGDIGHVPWQARAYDMLAYMYFSVGDIRQALEYNDTALKTFRSRGITLGLLDASWNRGLILMAMSDFAAARSYLLQARQEYADLGLSINAAHCHLRLAGIAVLMGDKELTWEHITPAFDVLYRVGGVQDLLYLIDIYSGYLMLSQQAYDTLALVELCQRFRSERNISRGAMLEQVMEQQVALAQRLAAALPYQEPVFQQTMTFYEVLVQMRTQLNVH